MVLFSQGLGRASSLITGKFFNLGFGTRNLAGPSFGRQNPQWFTEFREFFRALSQPLFGRIKKEGL